MPFSIPLTGLAANDPVPGNYLEINFAQGAASLGTATYAVLLLGNKSTAGDATVNTVIYGPGANSPLPLSSSADAIARFGQGSELHRMWRRFTKVNTVTPVYAVAVAESVGAAATQALTFATTATGNGTARYYVGDEFVDAAITTGDTAIVIAGNMATAINSKLDWAVTAANGGSAVCTLTAKNLGLRGNQLRGSCVILGSNVGTTSSITSQTLFTGGTTADSSTTALATILPYRFYYIVSAAEDATQLQALNAQINAQALPTVGIRQRAVAGSMDPSTTASAVTTIATNAAINSARMEIVWMLSSEWTPAEIAANMAAVYSLEETPLSFRCNFSGYGSDAITSTRWFMPPSKSGVAPTRAVIKACLNNGVTPIATLASGGTYLVKRITTRSLSGSNNDYRIRDAHKVTVCDRFGDDWLNKCALEFSGKKIVNDPLSGQKPPGPGTVSPRNIRGSLLKLIDDYSDLELVQDADGIKKNTLVIRESSPTTRASCKVPLETIDILDQIATSLDQTA